jgi:hypothetical protein
MGQSLSQKFQRFCSLSGFEYPKPFRCRAAADRVACGRAREAVHTAETRKLGFEQYGRTENRAQLLTLLAYGVRIGGESRVGDEGMKGINEGKKEVFLMDCVVMCLNVP